MLKDLFTVVYYTSNREDPVFEQKIREDLLGKIGDLPLISVSQKPLPDFGKNICIGDWGASEQHLFKQVLIGCEMAETPYIITAEADCLYPKEYFSPTFRMSDVGRYFMDNVWIFYPHSGLFYYKSISDCAKVCDRIPFIDLLQRQINGNVVPRHEEIRVPFAYPVINIKTGMGLRKHTQVSHAIPARSSIEYWGTAEDVRRRVGL